MEIGKFYFMKDAYYEKFKDCNLSINKDDAHKRPCYYCCKYDNLYWMIPISSKIQKYQKLYAEKFEKYGNRYLGIRFGFVNGKKKAFLIQNICPVTEKYINNKYKINNNSVDVTINKDLANELNGIAKKVIKMFYHNGKNIPFTDLKKIIDGLNEEYTQEAAATLEQPDLDSDQTKKE